MRGIKYAVEVIINLVFVHRKDGIDRNVGGGHRFGQIVPARERVAHLRGRRGRRDGCAFGKRLRGVSFAVYKEGERMRGGFNGRLAGSQRGLNSGRGDFDARAQGKADVIENDPVSANRQRDIGIEDKGEDYARIARNGLVGGRVAHNAQRTVGQGVGHKRVAEGAVAGAQRAFC